MFWFLFQKKENVCYGGNTDDCNQPSCEKGEKAYLHHKIFHEKMVMAVLDSLNPQETKDLTKALLKLQRFFDDYGKE